MILNFSVGNFRSFQTIQTLDLRATTQQSDNKEVDRSNVVERGSNRILKAIAIYGPNGSGKSNFISALHCFKFIVERSLEMEGVADFIVDPFLSPEPAQKDGGFFQILILVSDKKYRYGFQLSAQGEIQQEWLYGPAEKNETWYFKRTRQDIKSNEERFDEGLRLPLDKLRADTLFLTFVSAYDGPVSNRIRSFITTRLVIEQFDLVPRRGRLTTRTAASRFDRTNALLDYGKKNLVLQWLRSAGLNYADIRLDDHLGHGPTSVVVEKQFFDPKGSLIKVAPLQLETSESAGTQKFYAYIGWLYDIFLNGGVFVSDEIDNNFHPSLLKQLLQMFQDPEINVAGGQLLFTTHDINLLDNELLRRDQIYFTEKNIQEETILYSLSDLKGIRNNADFARQYLAGLYGALPQLVHLQERSNESSSRDDDFTAFLSK